MNDVKTKLNYNIRLNSLWNNFKESTEVHPVLLWISKSGCFISQLWLRLKVFVIHPVMEAKSQTGIKVCFDFFKKEIKKNSVLTKILLCLGSKMLNNTLKENFVKHCIFDMRHTDRHAR